MDMIKRSSRTRAGLLGALSLGLVFAAMGCQPGLLTGVGGAGGGDMAPQGPSTVAVTSAGGGGDTGAGGMMATNSNSATAASTGTGNGGGEGGALNQSLFVLVGDEGQIATTTDGAGVAGVVAKTGMASDDLRDVTFADGRFFAVGGDAGQGVLLRSKDGSNWQSLPVSSGGWFGGIAAFGKDPSTLVMVGEQAGVWWSDDGGDSLSAGASMATGGVLRAVAASDSLVVAVGEDGSGAGMSSASPDGKTWDAPVVGGEAFRSVAFGNGVFVAVGDTGRCAATVDGANWTDFALSMDAYASVSFVDGTFIVGGVQGEFRSTDGYTWGFVSASERRHFAYGNGRFVALTEAGAVYGSTDGSTWYDGPTMGAPNRAIAFGEPAAP